MALEQPWGQGGFSLTPLSGPSVFMLWWTPFSGLLKGAADIYVPRPSLMQTLCWGGGEVRREKEGFSLDQPLRGLPSPT